MRAAADGGGANYGALGVFALDHAALIECNAQSLDVEMLGRFELATILGTKGRVINHHQEIKLMRELAHFGGVIYLDLPLAGDHNHGCPSRTTNCLGATAEAFRRVQAPASAA